MLEGDGVAVVFSTRAGGVSTGAYESLNLGLNTEDDYSDVLANRARLATEIGLGEGRIAAARQIHGDGLRRWQADEDPPAFCSAPDPLVVEEADGHITRVAGLGLLVLVADCFPVVLSGGGQVAMLHCGWRGIAAGIIERAMEQFDTPPSGVVGPGIGPCCFEVGDEVRARFADVPEAAAGRMLDLRAVIEARLTGAGVRAIDRLDLCTSCRSDLFFSHRRDGGVTGRQAAVAWLI